MQIKDTHQVTTEDCQKVVELLRKKYGYLGDYVLIQPAEHWVDYDNGQMYVCWEEGEYEWTMHIEPDAIPGLFLEPYNTFVLSVSLKDDEEMDELEAYRSEYRNGGQW